MMKTEWKICLPAYKLCYALCFVVFFCVIRGVTLTYEIGVALEPAMALFAMLFCANTYTQEISSGRSQIQRLYPMDNRLRSMAERLFLQEIVLLLLSAAGYGLSFLLHRPQTQDTGTEIRIFLIFLAAVLVTLWLWGMLSNFLSCLFRNRWAGIGCCLALWIMTDSSFGKKSFGNWNLFSYALRDIKGLSFSSYYSVSGAAGSYGGTDFHWIYGKILCILLCIGIALMMPAVLKKKG